MRLSERTLLFVAALALTACDDEYIPPKAPTKVAQPEATPSERRDAACKAKDLPTASTPVAMEGPTDLPQGAVVRVEFEGAKDEGAARAAAGIAAGDALTLEKTQKAVRGLYALGGLDDVRMEARASSGQGIVLHFTLVPRVALGEVVVHGGSVVDVPELENAFHATSGAPYDPAAIVQVRSKLAATLREKGYSDAVLNVVGARAEGKVDLCIDLREGSKVTVDSVAFRGLAKVKEEELRPLIDTDHGRINAPGGVVDQAKLDEAVMKMTEVLDAHGLAKGTIQIKSVRTGDKVALALEVDEGPVVVLRRYDVKGDLAAPESAYHKVLSLKSKDPFSRAKLVADIQKIGEINDKHGHKDFQVQPQTQVDDKDNTVDIVLMVIDPKKLKAPPPPPKK